MYQIIIYSIKGKEVIKTHEWVQAADYESRKHELFKSKIKFDVIHPDGYKARHRYTGETNSNLNSEKSKS